VSERAWKIDDGGWRGMVARMRAQFGFKLCLFLLLPPIFEVVYLLPQRVPMFEARRIPLTWVDRAVPFSPAWVLPYLSMYLLLPLPGLLATRREELWRYSIGLAVMFVVACVIFFACPVEYPRPATPPDGPWVYRVMVSIDRPINALPSLHAGLVVFTLMFAARVMADWSQTWRRPLLALGWLWGALILYGTLATKQHYFVDLPTGALLAWASYWIAWRDAPAGEIQGKVARKGDRHAVVME
jgi:membrane-associated phospholipid phosphatase